MNLTLMLHSDDVPPIFEVGEVLTVISVCPQGSLICRRASDDSRSPVTDAVWPEETNIARVVTVERMAEMGVAL